MARGRKRIHGEELIKEVLKYRLYSARNAAAILGIDPHVVEYIRSRFDRTLTTNERSRLIKSGRALQLAKSGGKKFIPVPRGAEPYRNNPTIINGFKSGLNPRSKEPPEQAAADFWLGFALGRDELEKRNEGGGV